MSDKNSLGKIYTVSEALLDSLCDVLFKVGKIIRPRILQTTHLLPLPTNCWVWQDCASGSTHDLPSKQRLVFPHGHHYAVINSIICFLIFSQLSSFACQLFGEFFITIFPNFDQLKIYEHVLKSIR